MDSFYCTVVDYVTDIHAFQAKEYLANPDAFAVAAAPAAETTAVADAPKEEAKPAEEEAESDDDMVSYNSRFTLCCITKNLIAGLWFVRLIHLFVFCLVAQPIIMTVETK